MKKNPHKVPAVTHDTQGRTLTPSVSEVATGMLQALSDTAYRKEMEKKNKTA